MTDLPPATRLRSDELLTEESDVLIDNWSAVTDKRPAPDTPGWIIWHSAEPHAELEERVLIMVPTPDNDEDSGTTIVGKNSQNCTRCGTGDDNCRHVGIAAKALRNWKAQEEEQTPLGIKKIFDDDYGTRRALITGDTYPAWDILKFDWERTHAKYDDDRDGVVVDADALDILAPRLQAAGFCFLDDTGCRVTDSRTAADVTSSWEFISDSDSETDSVQSPSPETTSTPSAGDAASTPEVVEVNADGVLAHNSGESDTPAGETVLINPAAEDPDSDRIPFESSADIRVTATTWTNDEYGTDRVGLEGDTYDAKDIIKSDWETTHYDWDAEAEMWVIDADAALDLATKLREEGYSVGKEVLI